MVSRTISRPKCHLDGIAALATDRAGGLADLRLEKYENQLAPYDYRLCYQDIQGPWLGGTTHATRQAHISRETLKGVQDVPKEAGCAQFPAAEERCH